jgi:hypothetical protein
MPERVNGGNVLIAIGALALLVSLFLDWYQPGVSAWTVFEIVDLLLAVIAIAAVFGAFTRAVPRAGLPEPPRIVESVLALAALVLVVAALINPPPAAIDLDPDTGAWIALAGVVLMAIGALLGLARVSFVITLSPRERSQPPPPEPPFPPPPPPPPSNPGPEAAVVEEEVVEEVAVDEPPIGPPTEPLEPIDEPEPPPDDTETRRLDQD